MAKNVEVKESNKKRARKKHLLQGICNVAKFVAYVDVKVAEFSHEKAASMSYSVYFMCIGLTEDPISQ